MNTLHEAYTCSLQDYSREYVKQILKKALIFLLMQHLKNCEMSVILYLKDCTRKVLEVKPKVTPVLTQLEEDKLWESGVLNLNTPVGLLRSVFFYNGKSFCLRGGQ